MGVFRETVQILSELAIHENGMEIPKTTTPAVANDLKSFLESIPTVGREDSFYSIDLIPVRRSQKLGKYLIEMEDLSRYMLTNDIRNIREAVSNILEYNNIPDQYHKTALVVDQNSILGELANLGFDTEESSVHTKTIGQLGDYIDIDQFRKLANSKAMLDQIVNNYGLPVVKKVYDIGPINKPLSQTPVEESTETVKIKVPKNAEILQEEQPKKLTDNDIMDSIVNKTDIMDQFEQNQNFSDPYEQELQYIRDVAKGLYDDQ